MESNAERNCVRYAAAVAATALACSWSSAWRSILVRAADQATSSPKGMKSRQVRATICLRMG